MPAYEDPKAKDRNKRWYYNLYYTDERGKRKTIKKRGFRTKREAEAAEDELKVKLRKGEYNHEGAKSIFRDVMRDWLRDKKSQVKEPTYEVYTYYIEKVILPDLGHLELGKVSPRHIMDFYNKLHDSERLCDENIQKVHTLINAALKRAYKWGMIGKNVAELVDRPQADVKEREIWSPEEAKQFLAAAKDDRYFVAFYLPMVTGMRQGEVLGLRWKDVDFDKATIAVTQTLTHDGKNLQFGAKSKKGSRKKGVRIIAIDREYTLPLLQKLFARTRLERMAAGPAYQNKDLVISTTIGTQVLPRNLMRSFYRLNKKADVKKITYHGLRHTHVTHLLMAKENPKVICERLGWTSTKMLERYAHLLPHLQEQTATNYASEYQSYLAI